MKLGTALVIALVAAGWGPQPARSGNPILPGWYADPEAHVFGHRYWIYPTYSAPYDEQTFLDAFSSPDLITWTKHPRVLDGARIPWIRRALWAPSIVEKDGWYYLFFGANDIQSDKEPGGIGIARSRRPEGPFDDYLGKPLIDRFHNGAQPIDQFVFRDRDGSYYIVYGGWRHCNIAKLNADFTGFVPFDDGTVFREITPRGYVEGAFMLLRDGKYYFMWSEGGWTGPNYAVAYAIGDSPSGPFERIGRILEQDPSIATGAGHHSVLMSPRSGRSYIVYHRRPLDRTDRNHRVVSIEELRFDERGRIVPVVLTKEGVAADPLAIARAYIASYANDPRPARRTRRIGAEGPRFQVQDGHGAQPAPATPVIVVDTSVWVAALRRNGEEAGVLRELLDSDEVLLPVPVKLELLSGTSGRQRAALRSGLTALPLAYPTDDTWRLMDTWTDRAVKGGTSFGVGDLLIGAMAHQAGALVWSLDDAFVRMERLRLVERYVP